MFQPVALLNFFVFAELEMLELRPAAFDQLTNSCSIQHVIKHQTLQTRPISRQHSNGVSNKVIASEVQSVQARPISC